MLKNKKMVKFYKFFEYAYLVIALLFAFEAYRIWNEEPNQAYLFLGFVAVAIFMFFFKRRFRKKVEDSQKQ